MKTRIIVGSALFFLVQLVVVIGFCQSPSLTPLFQVEEPLAMRMSLTFKEIKKNTTDSTFLPSVLYYKRGEQWDSIKIAVRSRGDFRKKKCYFTPLHIKIKKEDSKGTPFEGNKSLKLVLPCETSKNNNTLLIKEYMCYQLYEPITPYTFNTRLVTIDLNEGTGSKVKNFKITGFFIEDDELVAKRYNAKVVENLNLHPLALRDTFAIQHDFFQYMIANTDWSTAFFHNAKLIKIEPDKYIPLAYDFDMAGFVDAPYAVVDESLGIASVRDRVYRGFCRKNDEVLQYVRKQYIDDEPELKKILALYEQYFDAKEFASVNKYMDEFFTMMKSDKEFQQNIVMKCRKK